MNTRAITPGTIIRFAREGATSTSPSGTVSATVKPDATDAAFLNVGTVVEGESEYDEQVRETVTIVNGQRHKADVLKYGASLKLSFTLEEYSDFVSALRFGHLPLDGSGGQFNPLERVKPMKGWLKMQETDPVTGSNVTVLDAWVYVKLSGALSMGEQGPKPQIECDVLYSTLNTGTLLAA